MRQGGYRGLVIAWALLYLWWSTLPYSTYKQPAAVQEALQHAGRGAVFPPNDTFADVLLGATLLSAAGLLFFQRWARILLVVSTLVSVVQAPVSGVLVSGPVDGTIGFIQTLLTGGLLAVVFWSPLAARFVKTASTDDAVVETEQAEPDAASKLVTVFETSDATVIPVIHSLLQSADIEYTTTSETLQDLVAGGRLAGYNTAAGNVKFLVREADALIARDVLAVEGPGGS